MNNIDVFSGLSWGDLKRYKLRNDTVVRERRAAELDQRIKDFNAKPRSLQWANDALEFCNREHAQNKDVFAISKEAFRLSELKSEAELILKNERERIAADKQAYASSTDDTIRTLASAPRGEYWSREVKDLDTDIQKNMPRDVRVMLKNLNQLQKLVQEADLLIQAANIDASIRSLMDSKNKDKTWLSSVDTLNKSITPKLRPLIKEAELHGALQKEYLKVQRKPIFSQYEACLYQIERGAWSMQEERNNYNALNSQLKTHKFSMQEYIEDFNNRWSKAKGLVDAETNRLIEAEKARKQAEIDRNNRNTLRPYVECIETILNGGEYSETNRNLFDSLDKTITSINFSAELYERDFYQRWSQAKKRVNDEKVRLKEAALEQERRLIQKLAAETEARIAREKRQKRKKQIIGIVIAISGYILFSLLMYFGFSWAMGIGRRFYTLFVTIESSMISIHFSNSRTEKHHPISGIVGQVILYIEAIAFSVLFGYGVFNIIVCCAAIAAITNGYVYGINFDNYKFRIFQAFASILPVAVLILGLEYWLAAKVVSSFWNALWLAPFIIIIVTALYAFTTESGDDGSEFSLSLIWALVTTITVIIRSIGVVCAVTGFSFGMFFFVVLQIILMLLGGCIGIGVCYGVTKLVDNKIA